MLSAYSSAVILLEVAQLAEKPRVIQEYVPGKQVTLAHLIANPRKELCEKLGLPLSGALGIITITPCEAAIIAADIATKTAAVQVGFLDRFTGSLVVCGAVSAVEAALVQVNDMLAKGLGFTAARLTRS
ncbi:ethanolamine utilization protein EutS [Sporolituus thermophilus DSM 23256]|uniref:Ethanolamine utilization protein EutS n=1 Tax=Sporolituus thermophilus DSM 23256 TaxID=1123285 RepID=A0A1G7M364_9FIRM|nr:ethanolamine utilization protein EutS [Sporolituus thermophilus DSM 23256]